MNFLAPLFLFGALAVAGPIIFHLIRRTTREVKPFSSLMFLQPTPPRVTRRSRIENVWLLLLRCLVLLALAAGFARPFFRQAGTQDPVAAGNGRHLAVLVDTSASMRRESLWLDARKKVEALLSGTTPLDSAALLVFDRSPRVLIDPERWRTIPVQDRVANAIGQLAATSPGWGGTNLGAVLLQALDLISGARKDAPATGEIVVITDLQEGARLDGLQGLEWPATVKVRFETVATKANGNAAVQWLVDEGEKEQQPGAATLRLRVNNAPESKTERVRLSWAAAAKGSGLDAYAPAGQSRTVRIPMPPAGAEKIMLSGDDTDFDNTLWFLPPQSRRVPVLFFGTDAEEDTRGALYYLRLAFPKTRHEIVEILPRKADQAVATFEMRQAQLVVLGSAPGDAQLTAARQFAEEGRLVVAPLGSAADARWLGRLTGASGITATEVTPGDYAMLAQIDFEHPLFSAFADPRFSDFTKIHFWRYRKLDPAKFPGARVLASFENRDPAILHIPVGKGAVIVLTSSWRPDDSQLALSSKFVPLLHAMLDQSAGLPPAKAQYFVGDEIVLPPAPVPWKMRKPDGSEVDLAAGARFAATDLPGIYEANPGALRFVVNIPPEESRTSPMSGDRLAALGLPLDPAKRPSSSSPAGGVPNAAAAEAEQRQKLWRWLMVAALIILFVETAFAARLSKPRQLPEVLS
ncbi:MAG: BatA domain-containing protein [Chthoniobacteraceae bacterium]